MLPLGTQLVFLTAVVYEFGLTSLFPAMKLLRGGSTTAAQHIQPSCLHLLLT